MYRQVSKYTENGICIETIFHGHGAELPTGEIFLPVDKRTAQGFGSALTYARRYSLSLACGVGVDDDDGNQAEKEVGKKPVPKKTPVKKAEPVKEEVVEEDAMGSKGWADAFVHGFIKTLELYATRDEVVSAYKNNSEEVGTLKDKFPKHYEALTVGIQEYTTNLPKEVKDGG